MGKGSAPAVQKVENVSTNLPTYLEPYVTSIAGQAQALTDTTRNPYQPYSGERISGFTPGQQQVQQNVLGMQTPGQFDTGTAMATAAGLGSIAAGQYNPTSITSQQVGLPSLQNYQMQNVQAAAQPTYDAPGMQAAQGAYDPNLQYFQMDAPGQFGQAQVDQYMSPYMQNVVDIEKREAARSAKQGQLAQDLGAARQGSYGGSRQLLATLERERNLGTLMGDIQAKGQQSAYENAQQQFERDRAAGMSAGQQNLAAKLGVQGLATETGAKMALANLDARQQANVQNLAAQLQTQGLNAEQALKVALANQQAGLTTNQQNLGAQLQTQDLGTRTSMQALLANQQADLDAQRMTEQSKQFGADLGLRGYGQAGQMAQTLSNLGSAQQQSDIARLGMQQGTAAQEQALYQQYLDTQYQDYLRQQDYPMSQLERYNNIIRGLPSTMGTTTTTSVPGQSIGSQLMSAGLGGLSMARTAGVI